MLQGMGTERESERAGWSMESRASETARASHFGSLFEKDPQLAPARGGVPRTSVIKGAMVTEEGLKSGAATKGGCSP